MVDDMYILIPWGKEHAIDEVCWCRMWIGLDGWVYVLDKWLNGSTMKVEIPGHVDIAISRQVLSRSKVKLELCKLIHCLKDIPMTHANFIPHNHPCCTK